MDEGRRHKHNGTTYPILPDLELFQVNGLVSTLTLFSWSVSTYLGKKPEFTRVRAHTGPRAPRAAARARRPV